MRELPSADAAVVWLARMQARVKPMMPMDDCRRDRRSTESGRPSTPYAAGQPVGGGSRRWRRRQWRKRDGDGWSWNATAEWQRNQPKEGQILSEEKNHGKKGRTNRPPFPPEFYRPAAFYFLAPTASYVIFKIRPMSYFHKGNRMALHRNANTPPPKPGYFMVLIYPQVVHSVVF